jgi:hypothetical protein
MRLAKVARYAVEGIRENCRETGRQVRSSGWEGWVAVGTFCHATSAPLEIRRLATQDRDAYEKACAQVDAWLEAEIAKENAADHK